MTENSFWAATERAEQSFTGEADVRAFRRRMRRLGHEGTPVLIITRKPRDKYGRWLAEIYPTDPSGNPEAVSVNKQLIDAGHAVPYMPGGA